MLLSCVCTVGLTTGMKRNLMEAATAWRGPGTWICSGTIFAVETLTELSATLRSCVNRTSVSYIIYCHQESVTSVVVKAAFVGEASVTLLSRGGGGGWVDNHSHYCVN